MHSTMDFSLHFPEVCDDVTSWGMRQEGPRHLSGVVIGHFLNALVLYQGV